MDAFRKSAEQWKTLNEEQKSKYTAKAKVDDERYKK